LTRSDSTVFVTCLESLRAEVIDQRKFPMAFQQQGYLYLSSSGFRSSSSAQSCCGLTFPRSHVAAALGALIHLTLIRLEQVMTRLENILDDSQRCSDSSFSSPTTVLIQELGILIGILFAIQLWNPNPEKILLTYLTNQPATTKNFYFW